MTNVSPRPFRGGRDRRGTGSGVRAGSRLRRYVDSSGLTSGPYPLQGRQSPTWTDPRPRGNDHGMRSIWKGAISFGLVSIPVKLYSATEERDVSFHQVHREDA